MRILLAHDLLAGNSTNHLARITLDRLVRGFKSDFTVRICSATMDFFVRITTSTNSGQTLWKRNNPYLLSVWPKADIDLIESEMSKVIGDKDITLPAADGELKSLAIRYIKEHPGLTLRNAVFKGLLYFSQVPIPMSSGIVRVENGVASLMDIASRAYFTM